VGHFFNFHKKTVQSKPSPIGLKFAQSGCPGTDVMIFKNFFAKNFGEKNWRFFAKN
jgi:hypothetical protein